MNKKSLIVTLLLFAFLVPMANAGLMDSYDKTKSKLQQFDNSVTSARNTAATTKATTKANIQSQKTSALKQIKSDITAKQKEIANVKKANILETERTVRLKKLNAELTALQKKYTTTEAYYDKKLAAIK